MYAESSVLYAGGAATGVAFRPMFRNKTHMTNKTSEKNDRQESTKIIMKQLWTKSTGNAEESAGMADIHVRIAWTALTVSGRGMFHRSSEYGKHDAGLYRGIS